NTSSESYGIELNGAINVTISGLSITGGAVGIYADAGSGSRGLTVQHADLYGNTVGGDLEASNDDASITDSTIHGSPGANNGSAGIFIAADRPVIRGNTIYGNGESGGGDGVYILADSPMISGNTIDDNGGSGVTTGGQYSTIDH